jgi:hypothetical protein
MPPEAEKTDSGTQEPSAEELAKTRGDTVEEPEAKAEEPEAKAEEPEAKAEEPEAKVADLIPRSRYNLKAKQADTERQRREAVEAELAKLQAERQAPPPTPVEPKTQSSLDDRYQAVETKLIEARKDADLDAELAAMRELRALDRETFAAQVEAARTSAVQDAVGHMDWETTLTAVEDLYPQLNPDADGYSQAMDERVNTLVNGFVNSGKYTHTEALMEAVALVFPESPDKPAEKPADTRAVAAVQKGVEAAKAQPPQASSGARSPTGVGVSDPDSLDITKLSDAEMDALPLSTLKRLRGDEYVA